MAGRFTGQIGRFAGRPWSVELGRQLDEFFRNVKNAMSKLQGSPVTPLDILLDGPADAGVSGVPANDDHVHDLPAGAPVNPTGKVAAEGVAVSALRSDATIAQGIVTTKGDILGHDATTAERVPAGANGTSPVYDSAAATGISTTVSPWKGSRTKALTNTVATGLFEVALPAGAMCGGVLHYAVRVIDAAGDLQVVAGYLVFAATNKGGVFETDINDMAGVASAVPTPTAGTITLAFSMTSGASKVTVLVAATSTLTPTTLEARFVLDSLDGQVITFL